MQHWEYHTTLLMGVGFANSKGWRVKEINEQVQPDWKKMELYTSVTDFCNQMDQQGWELVSAAYPGETVSYVILHFKRSLQQEG